MNEIIVKLIDKEEGISREVEIYTLEYNEQTTFSDVLGMIRISNINVFEYPFTTRTNKDGNKVCCVKYLLIDGTVKWLVPINECKIIDFVGTYNCDEIKLYMPKNIGGPSLPYIEWEFILTSLDFLFSFAGYAVVSYDLFKISKAIKAKYQTNNKKWIPLDIVKEFIRKREYWSLDEFKFEMNLVENVEVAQLLLNLSGYIYDIETNLFFYNATLARKRDKEFNIQLSRYIEEFGWDERFCGE